MTNTNLLQAMGRIDPKLIADAAPDAVQKKPTNKTWVKWTSLAACLVLAFTFIFPLIQITQDKLPTEDMQIIEFNNSYYEVCDDKSLLKKYGVNQKITEADAGEFITYLTKKNPGGKSEYIATNEKTGIILYSYVSAPCEAVYVICENEKYNAVLFCYYVLSDTENAPLNRLYKHYDVDSGADISSISVVDNKSNKKVVGTILTDTTTLSDFYMFTLNLQDYNFSDYHEMNYGHIKTEEELIQAYEKTSDDKITLRIETVNGLRFYVEYDASGGWLYSSGTQRYYQVTSEISNWFENHLK